MNVRQVMTADVYTVLPGASINEIARLMRDKDFVGMVSIGDLSAGATAERAGESLTQISAPRHH